MFCGNCGSDMGENPKFCPHCGKKLLRRSDGTYYMEERVADESNDKTLGLNNTGSVTKNVNTITIVAIAVAVIAIVCCLCVFLFLPKGQEEKIPEKMETVTTEKNVDLSENPESEEETTPDNDDIYEEYIEYSDEDISQEAIDARWYDEDLYILPNSDTERLDEDDIRKLNLKTIQFAIDEICARHGRKFRNNRSDYHDMKEYFLSKSWYEEIYEPKEFDSQIQEILNEVEYYNFNLLAKIRNEKKK